MKNRIMKKFISAITIAAVLGTTFLSSLGGMDTVEAGTMAPGGVEKAYEVASEGIVLLENENNTLPLKSGTNVALFGRGSFNTAVGGYGSANVNAPYTVDVYQALQERGDLNVNETILNTYLDWTSKAENRVAPAGGVMGGGSSSEKEMPLTDAQVEAAAKESSVAIVTLRRNSGEGVDRNLDPGTYTSSTSNNNSNGGVSLEFEQGDYYLSSVETAMMEKVDKYFDKVIVLLNVGGIIDMNWVDEYESIQSVVLMSQPGMEGSYTVNDMLIGKVNPSGKLTDTWANEYDDYPSSASFKASDPTYDEDIYVGYRYFETFAPDDVRYEFGFGMSYSDFEVSTLSVDTSGGVTSSIKVKANVKNVGQYTGKETVQVYFNAPDGSLKTPDRQLVAYAKTDDLKPGQEQVINLTFDVSDMAAYDDSNVTGNESCYVLEAGAYDLYVGNSVKSVAKAGTYNVASTTVVEELTELVAPKTSFDIMTKDASGNLTTEAVSLDKDPTITYDTSAAWVFESSHGHKTLEADENYTLEDVYNGDVCMECFITSMPDLLLTQLLSGGTSNAGGGTSSEAPGGAAGTFGSAQDYGIPMVVVADGPSGLVLRATEEAPGNTAFPIATMLAQTWNVDLIEEYGEIVGTEMAQDGVDLWLSPALNTHRNPLGGRNFEYYSEDPLVSGMVAAASTRGVQSQGVGVTLKHFAGNEQETNRMRGQTHVSERALREIHLKGFQIAVEDANPWAIMSSYNLLNGNKASSNVELLSYILRDEWGFSGLVMTDWGGSGDEGNESQVRAQNDLRMPSGTTNVDNIDGSVMSRYQLQRSVRNVLEVIMESKAFRDSIGEPLYYAEVDGNLVDHSKEEVKTYYEDTEVVGYKEALQTMIDIAEDALASNDFSKKTDEDRAALQAVIDASKAVRNDYYASEDALSDAALDLVDALSDFSKDAADKDILESFMVVAGVVANDTGKYTEASINALKEVLAAAQEVFDDSYAKQADVNKAADDLAAALANMQKKAEDPKSPLPFTDVFESDWFYEYVEYVYENGIMTGMNATTFGPGQNFTREQLAVVLHRMEGTPSASYSSKFKDIPNGQWYTEAIMWAAEKGIVTGYENGYFGLGDSITRQDTTVMFYRYAKYKGYDVSKTSELTSFPDASRVSSYAVDAIKWAVGNEIITGDGGNINPRGTSYRAVAATIITRFMTNIK